MVTEVLSAAESSVVAGLALAGIVVGLIVIALFVLAFVVLARRSRHAATAVPPTVEIGLQANIALVRLDDTVASTAEELGFAVAQFGEQRTVPFASALTAARSTLTEAFALKKRLDDSTPDTSTQHREWNARILNLCGSASATLTSQRALFDGLRALERDAPADLAEVRALITDGRGRLDSASGKIADLATRYASPAIAPVAAVPTEVPKLLDRAQAAADAASTALSSTGTAGDAAALVQAAGGDARRATALLDQVDTHVTALAAASGRLAALVVEVRAEARAAEAVRDAPPDPATGALVGAEIAAITRALADATVSGGAADPDAAISTLDAASDNLDIALAGARNLQQRLEHATEALSGALLTARSQLQTTSTYIAGRRGGVGADARTRLAEAARLLTIAEAEADPVIALDTARSSATHSRDADALARYDLLH